MGFLDPQDERFLGTLAAIRAELEVSEGLVHRSRAEQADDGLPGAEHPFLACSFWLADAFARCDDVEGAGRVLDRLIRPANAVELLAEEHDIENAPMAGSVPQALSHLGLTRAVHSYDLAVQRQQRRV